ncbi:MAG: type IV conjugative transfer system protein TraL [Pseudomonadota bacterium]
MNYNRNVILKYLDSPSRFAFWTIDELLALMVPFLGGFILEIPLKGIILSGLSYWLLRKSKQFIGGAKLSHLIYWYLPSSNPSKKLRLPSHIRQYLG